MKRKPTDETIYKFELERDEDKPLLVSLTQRELQRMLELITKGEKAKSFGTCGDCGKLKVSLDADFGWCEECCKQYAKEQGRMENTDVA